jgi:hypothetical protein
VSFPACLIVGGALSVAIAFVIARR